MRQVSQGGLFDRLFEDGKNKKEKIQAQIKKNDEKELVGCTCVPNADKKSHSPFLKESLKTLFQQKWLIMLFKISCRLIN